MYAGHPGGPRRAAGTMLSNTSPTFHSWTSRPSFLQYPEEHVSLLTFSTGRTCLLDEKPHLPLGWVLVAPAFWTETGKILISDGPHPPSGCVFIGILQNHHRLSVEEPVRDLAAARITFCSCLLDSLSETSLPPETCRSKLLPASNW